MHSVQVPAQLGAAQGAPAAYDAGGGILIIYMLLAMLLEHRGLPQVRVVGGSSQLSSSLSLSGSEIGGASEYEGLWGAGTSSGR
jgi:hypothetical protein